MIGKRPDPARTSSGLLVPVLGSLVLATASLFVLKSSVAYDPWSWLIWGRQITHLSLDTREAATAVKPLPIFINTLFAPTGSLAPALWLLVARAATLLSFALAFRLGRRLGGPVAGLVAAVGLAVADQYLGYLFMRGMSEPMATATVLGAVDCYMQGRRRGVLVWLVAAGLLRPEAWPFLLGYSFWLAYRQPLWRRAVSAVLSVSVVAVWFVIDWFGSGQFFRSAGAASHESQGGPLLARQPGLATIRETWHLMSGPILVLFLLGLVAELTVLIRTRRASATLWIAIGAIAWLGVDAVLAQGRFATGAPRYLLPGVALACVVAGVFVAAVAKALTVRLRSAPASLAVTALVCVVVGLLLGPRLVATERSLHGGIHDGRRFAQQTTNLRHVVSLAGGRHAIVACGPVSTQPLQVPLVAWELRVPLDHVEITPGATGTVIQQSGSPMIPTPLRPHYRSRASDGDSRPPSDQWTVLTTCGVQPSR